MKVAIYSALLLLLVYYASPLQLADSSNGGVPKDTSIVQQEDGDLQEPYGMYRRSRVDRDVDIASVLRKKRAVTDPVHPIITGQRYKETTYANIVKFVGKRKNSQETAKPKHIYIGVQPVTDDLLKSYANNLKRAVKPTPTMHIWHDPTIYGLSRKSNGNGMWVDSDDVSNTQQVQAIGYGPGAERPLNSGDFFYIIEGTSSIVKAPGHNRPYDEVTDTEFRSAYIIVRPSDKAHLDVNSIRPVSRVNARTFI